MFWLSHILASWLQIILRVGHQGDQTGHVYIVRMIQFLFSTRDSVPWRSEAKEGEKMFFPCLKRAFV